MNTGDACYMDRTGNGHSVDAEDKSVINRILLRFRPIAPKPTFGDPATDSLALKNNDSVISKRIEKRKYVRVNRNIGCRKKKSVTESDGGKIVGFDEKMMKAKNIETLQLLPERSNSEVMVNKSENIVQTAMIIHEMAVEKQSDLMGTVTEGRVAESWVTVECVMDTCMEVQEELGCTDMERMNNLERDTCPAFLSDGWNRVQWVNGAYRRMMNSLVRGGEGIVEMKVYLTMKDKVPSGEGAFACRVKLQYRVGTEKLLQIVPCDVWRMDCGGFAWRLDVKAALGLGR